MILEVVRVTGPVTQQRLSWHPSITLQWVYLFGMLSERNKIGVEYHSSMKKASKPLSQLQDFRCFQCISEETEGKEQYSDSCLVRISFLL